ncbi:MAG: HAD family hydrolase [Limisphaerales bacterium]|nr:HAD hydrolase-like protein [Verrucomicrobiota bacterium]
MVLKNIIFDWSGTLVNDLPPVMGATNFTLRKLGKKELSLDEFRADFCLPFTDFYEKMAPGCDLNQLEVWFHEAYIPLENTVHALDHAEDFLQFVKSNQKRTFLFSSMQRQHYESLLERIGFDQYLDHPYLGIVDKKERIGELILEHQILPEETLFIGDMVHDIETAHHGGLHSCAVLTGYTRLKELKDSEPELIVEDLGVLRELLTAADWSWNTVLERNSKPK